LYPATSRRFATLRCVIGAIYKEAIDVRHDIDQYGCVRPRSSVIV